MVHVALLLLMLEAADADLVSTISLKRNTPNLQLSTSGRPITPSFAGSGHGILAGMSTRPRSPAGDPMTLGNMRANGVRSLDGRAGSATI
jgi:hypothetical protein